MDNDEKPEESKGNDIHLLKSLHLIKLNFPSSNLFYIIMFLFKYIGIIANSRIIETVQNKEYTSINKYLSNFLIFGKKFAGKIEYYSVFTSLGAFILIFYFILFICSIIYMKFKYKNINSILDEKSHKVNEKLENMIFQNIIKNINSDYLFSSIYFRILFFWCVWLYLLFNGTFF